MSAIGIKSICWRVPLSSVKAVIVAVLFMCIFPAITESADSAGTVYIVFAIDTEPARPDPWQYDQNLNFSCFDKNGSNRRVAEIMELKWRRQYRDSFGNLPCFSWFIMSHEVFRHAANGGYFCVYDALAKYRESIVEYGDEIAWHYHHADWSDPNGDGKSSWNQLTTFDGTNYYHGSDVEIAERFLNYLLLDRGFFPTAFRAGWVWENNDFSRWLENIIPYDFSSYPPNKSASNDHEPLRNQYDWSRSPRSYSGYHPHFRDYQKIGRMHRWIFRTIAPNNRREWGKIFRAAKYTDQILCFTAHSYDNLVADIDNFLSDLLLMGDSLGVPLMFVSASQAGAAVSGEIESSPVNLEITVDRDRLIIHANGPIFQKSPYCVLIDNSVNCRRIFPQSDGTQRWIVDITQYSHFRFVCAACNRGGIPAVAEFHK